MRGRGRRRVTRHEETRRAAGKLQVIHLLGVVMTVREESQSQGGAKVLVAEGRVVRMEERQTWLQVGAWCCRDGRRAAQGRRARSGDGDG